jgi:hypothetical protein
MSTYSNQNQTHCQLGRIPSLTISDVVNGKVRKGTILLVDAPPGFRKTTEAIKWAAATASLGHQIVIIQPTRKRLKRTADELRALVREKYRDAGITITKIDSSDVKQTVRAIVDFFKSCAADESDSKFQGKILLITNKAAYQCPYIEGVENWHMIQDEPTDIQEFRIAINMEKTAGLIWQEHPELKRIREHDLKIDDKHLEQYFTTVPAGITGYVELDGRSDDGPDQIAANKSGDRVWEVFRELAAKVASPDWAVLMREPADDTLLTAEDEDTRQKKHLIAYPVPLPSFYTRFKSATIIGAYSLDTLLYRFFAGLDVNFVDHPDICPRLIAPDLDYSMVEFIYPYEVKWSKRRRDRDGGIRHIQFIAGVIREMGDEPFLYVTNNDQGKADPFKGQCPKGKPIEGKPHGLNDYADYDHVVVLSAFNPHPDHDRFLQALVGVNGFDVHTAIAKYAILQIVSRCSIRDPGNCNPKKIIIPDKMTAIWLAEKYPGARVRRLHIEPGDGREEIKRGRKRKWKSEAERVQAWRQQNAEQKRQRNAERMRRNRRGEQVS